MYFGERHEKKVKEIINRYKKALEEGDEEERIRCIDELFPLVKELIRGAVLKFVRPADIDDVVMESFYAFVRFLPRVDTSKKMFSIITAISQRIAKAYNKNRPNEVPLDPLLFMIEDRGNGDSKTMRIQKGLMGELTTDFEEEKTSSVTEPFPDVQQKVLDELEFFTYRKLKEMGTRSVRLNHLCKVIFFKQFITFLAEENIPSEYGNVVNEEKPWLTLHKLYGRFSFLFRRPGAKMRNMTLQDFRKFVKEFRKFEEGGLEDERKRHEREPYCGNLFPGT